MAKYFTTVQLASGEYKNIVFESEHRLKTWEHQRDFCNLLNKAGIELHDDYAFFFVMLPNHAYRCKCISRFMGNCFRLTKKNMDEQCFDDYPTIDLTEVNED